jgi:hypothetical protein
MLLLKVIAHACDCHSYADFYSVFLCLLGLGFLFSCKLTGFHIWNLCKLIIWSSLIQYGSTWIVWRISVLKMLCAPWQFYLCFDEQGKLAQARSNNGAVSFPATQAASKKAFATPVNTRSRQFMNNRCSFVRSWTTMMCWILHSSTYNLVYLPLLLPSTQL